MPSLTGGQHWDLLSSRGMRAGAVGLAPATLLRMRLPEDMVTGAAAAARA